MTEEIRPNYYKAQDRTGHWIEVFDVQEAFELGYHPATALAYILRANKKNETAVEDIKKAITHLSREVENLEWGLHKGEAKFIIRKDLMKIIVETTDSICEYQPYTGARYYFEEHNLTVQYKDKDGKKSRDGFDKRYWISVKVYDDEGSLIEQHDNHQHG